MSANPNAQKLAVAIGLIKEHVCECCTKISKKCAPSKYVPITEIDGVKNIDCRISYYSEKRGLEFEVKAEFKYDCHNDVFPILFRMTKYNKDGITSEDILAFSSAVLMAIPLLKLGYGGDLMPENKCESAVHKTFDDVFSSIACPTVVVDCMKECSVCYEKTNTKTPCKHSLCNRCWSKIQPVQDEDCDDVTPCPICRKNIHYI